MTSQSLPEKNEAEESQASELEAKQAEKSPVAESADGVKVSTQKDGEKLHNDPKDQLSKEEAGADATKPSGDMLKIFDDLLDKPGDASSLDPKEDLLSVTNFDELSLEAQDTLENEQITREEKVLDEDKILELSPVSSSAEAKSAESPSAPQVEHQPPTSPFSAEISAEPKIRSASDVRKSAQAKSEEIPVGTLPGSTAAAAEEIIERTEEKSKEHLINADPVDREVDQQALDGKSKDPSSSNLQDELLTKKAAEPESESPTSSAVESKSAEQLIDAKSDKPAESANLKEAKSEEQPVKVKSEESPGTLLEAKSAEQPFDAKADEPAESANLKEAKSEEQPVKVKSEESPGTLLEAKSAEQPIDAKSDEPAESANLKEAKSEEQPVKVKSEESPGTLLEAKSREQPIDAKSDEPAESSSILVETKSKAESVDTKSELSFEPTLEAPSATSNLLKTEQIDAKPEEPLANSDPLDFGQVMARVKTEEHSAGEAPTKESEENPFEYLKEPEPVSAPQKIDAYVNNSSSAQAPAGSTLSQEELEMLDDLHLYEREKASRLNMEEGARQAPADSPPNSRRTSPALTSEEMVSLELLNVRLRNTGQFDAVDPATLANPANTSLSEAINDPSKNDELAAVEKGEIAQTVRKISQDRSSMTTEHDRVLALQQYGSAKKTLLIGALAVCVFGMVMIPQLLHPSPTATQYQQLPAEKKPVETAAGQKPVETAAEHKPYTTSTPEQAPASSGQSGNGNYSPGSPNNPTGSPNPNAKLVYLPGTSKRMQQDKEKLRLARARLEFEIESAEGLAMDASKYKKALRSLDSDPNALSHADQEMQQIDVMAEELSRNLSARKFQLSPNSTMNQQVTFIGDKAIIGSTKPSYGVQKVSLRLAINEAKARGIDTKKYSQELQKIDQDINYKSHSDELGLKMRAMEADLQGKLNGAERADEKREKEQLDFMKNQKNPLTTQPNSTPATNPATNPATPKTTSP